MRACQFLDVPQNLGLFSERERIHGNEGNNAKEMIPQSKLIITIKEGIKRLTELHSGSVLGALRKCGKLGFLQGPSAAGAVPPQSYAMRLLSDGQPPLGIPEPWW